MRRRKLSDYIESDTLWEISPKARQKITYWTLRILLRLGGVGQFLSEGDPVTFMDYRLTQLLEIDEEASREEGVTRSMWIARWKEQLEAMEKHPPTYPKTLRRNLKAIRKLIGLNSVETDLLGLIVLAHQYDVMDNAVLLLLRVMGGRYDASMAALLGYRTEAVRQALDPRERLVRSGLIHIAADRMGKPLSVRYRLPLASFGARMMEQPNAIEAIVGALLPRCTAARLTMKDFDHLSSAAPLAFRYVSRALRRKTAGVNILLYGPPGTGKTEWAKALTSGIGAPLYSVNTLDEKGAPASAKERMQAYQFGLHFLGHSDAVILFDEVENILGGGGEGRMFFFMRKLSQEHKAWLNHTTESNPIPTVWIVNDISGIDPAVVRRFDVVIAMPIPPLHKRREILHRHGAKILSNETREKIAGDPNVSPAVMERAIRVVRQSRTSPKHIDRTAVNLIDATLQAQGHAPLGSGVVEMLPEGYDPRMIRCDTDLVKLADRLRRAPSARLCLYGAPGTGKSAFGRWLGEAIGQPVIVRQGSDLLSMYVGGTERNIARAFEQAHRDKAILIFDEVDSFLRERAGARNRWEVTQVNEMLTQMERYEGIFVATTNRIDDLDAASLRRFDLKLAFGYLLPDQVWHLFMQACRYAKIPSKETKRIREQVRALAYVTPGDFAAMRRQGRFDPIRSAEDLLRRLRREIEMKEDADTGAVGFLRA